jgi:hypothetical protein
MMDRPRLIFLIAAAAVLLMGRPLVAQPFQLIEEPKFEIDPYYFEFAIPPGITACTIGYSIHGVYFFWGPRHPCIRTDKPYEELDPQEPLKLTEYQPFAYVQFYFNASFEPESTYERAAEHCHKPEYDHYVDAENRPTTRTLRLSNLLFGRDLIGFECVRKFAPSGQTVLTAFYNRYELKHYDWRADEDNRIVPWIQHAAWLVTKSRNIEQDRKQLERILDAIHILPVD